MNETAAFQQITGLAPLDYGLLGIAVIALFAIAYFKGRGEKDTQDYFLGSRKTPVWIGTLSFVATEISAMTIVGIPPIGFTENLQYLQFFIG
ncbi:MAG: hypothetical protein A3J70_06825 [Elusimicrobia bacterium RIFCSPHIGHO2_02_FULL_61_10]|nr:MAG: hypothetical protein A3J70_06825 [Elusimicrobia bacterium RIFCSPHIGHO2_02_FULL_61_10]